MVDIIGANILNIARQDYDPQGASVTILISEQPVTPTESQIEESPGPLPETILGHLDKSHITVHTYPEIHPVDGIATFRVDIDVSTCGVISPLKALNYLIHQFDSDIVTVDYRVPLVYPCRTLTRQHLPDPRQPGDHAVGVGGRFRVQVFGFFDGSGVLRVLIVEQDAVGRAVQVVVLAAGCSGNAPAGRP